jgi:hypothetical protein
MSFSFLDSAQFADALAGLDDADSVGQERVQGDPRGPGGPPY